MLTNKLITRQDAIALSGLSSGHLSRLDKAGTITPQKFGGSDHPAVLYTPEQIKELQLVALLKNRLTVEEIKAVIVSFREHKHDSASLKGWLIFYKKEVYWAHSKQVLNKLIQQIVTYSDVATIKIVELNQQQDKRDRGSESGQL